MFFKRSTAIILLYMSMSVVYSQTYISTSFLSIKSAENRIDIQCGELFNSNIESTKFGALPLLKQSTNTAINKISGSFNFINPSNNGFLEGYSSRMIELHIYDIQGRIVDTQKIQGSFRLNFQNIPSGIYTLQFKQNHQLIQHKWIR